MKSAHLALSLIGALTIGLAGCGEKRSATADTGTSQATVTTKAPASQVPDDQLQSQAQQAATATATPVDGSGPVNTTTANTTPAKK